MTEREIEQAFAQLREHLPADQHILAWRLERRMILQHIAAEVLAANTRREQDERHLTVVT